MSIDVKREPIRSYEFGRRLKTGFLRQNLKMSEKKVFFLREQGCV